MKRVSCIAALFSLFLLTVTAQAREFSCDNYYDYLPPIPKIVGETSASREFNLYGDPEKDLDPPMNGIDDERYERLLELAARFSPLLHRNNFSVPRHFEDVLKLKYEKHIELLHDENQPILHIDTWELTKPVSRRVRSDFIDLALVERCAISDSNEVIPMQLESLYHDERLKRLLQEFHPDSAKIQSIRPEQDLRKVLYFDFQGTDERSWKRIYSLLDKKERAEKSRNNSKIYAHFFIYEDLTAQSSAGYEFVIQYWFFYPFNDGPNNHEGDWEHINVRITTRNRKGDLLTSEDITNILDNKNHSILDSLVIGKVDYYFHHYVITLDYYALGIDFYQTDEESFKSKIDRAFPATLSANIGKISRRITKAKYGQDYIHNEVYRRIHFIEGVVNTHPIGYIGADNIGLDQAFAGPGGKNRNAHGTHPFPGIWKAVGPLNATEKVRGSMLPPIKEEFEKSKQEIPWHKAINDGKWLSYGKENIILVPDWECIKDWVITNREVRRRWSWLILPVRWGFPIAKSPGAGIVKLKYADLGNAASVGPAYNSGWNRVGATAGYEYYDPYVLRSVLQISLALQDRFHNSWGFFNVPYSAFCSLPIVSYIALIPGLFLPNREENIKFYPHANLPSRFVSQSLGVFSCTSDDHFAQLLPQRENGAIDAFLTAHPGTKIDTKSMIQDDYSSVDGSLFNVHFSDRLSTETHFSSFSTSRVRYFIRDTEGKIVGTVEGNLELYELNGSYRYNFSLRFDKVLQLFIRAGYGWSWYKVRDRTLKLNGKVHHLGDTEWFHNPSFSVRNWWPNTLHAGFGFEIFSRNRPKWFFSKVGIRMEAIRLLHRLGDDAPANRGKVNVVRDKIGVSAVLSIL